MSSEKHIAVTGSNGLIGEALVRRLKQRGDRVTRLVRRSPKSDREAGWSSRMGIASPHRLGKVDAIVHLAGENIANKRWSEKQKKRIVDSRVAGTRGLVDSFQYLVEWPKTFISASAIGFYGNTESTPVDETAAAGEGFLAETCAQWESEAMICSDDTRVVCPRIGIVLSKDGGALPKMLLPMKLGVGGVIAPGNQWMSWIALEDLVSAFIFLLDNSSVSGPVNLVAPGCVTNESFSKTLARVVSRPCIFRVPEFAIRLLYGEMADGLLIQGARVKPCVLEESGFKFDSPELEKALRRILTKN